jgi:Cu(I)/Ag(I) efflux system membrane fusion protein
MKKDNSASNEIKLSDQQIKLENISLQAANGKQFTRKLHGVLTINQEKIKSISARAMN